MSCLCLGTSRDLPAVPGASAGLGPCCHHSLAASIGPFSCLPTWGSIHLPSPSLVLWPLLLDTTLQLCCQNGCCSFFSFFPAAGLCPYLTNIFLPANFSLTLPWCLSLYSHSVTYIYRDKYAPPPTHTHTQDEIIGDLISEIKTRIKDSIFPLPGYQGKQEYLAEYYYRKHHTREYILSQYISTCGKTQIHLFLSCSQLLWMSNAVILPETHVFTAYQ